MRLMYQCRPKQFVGLFIVSTIEGLLPLTYFYATGVLVDHLPAAVKSGSLSSQEGHSVVWLTLLLAALFAAQAIISSFANAYREGFRAIFAAYRREHIMRSTLIPPGIAHLEDPEYLDALELAATREWPDPGAFVVGVYGYYTERVTAVASGLLVGVLWHWWAAVLLVVAWAIAGRVLRIGQAQGYVDSRDHLRRSKYFHDLGYEARAAKEVRIFGLGDWIEDRFHQHWLEVMQDVWKKRKGSLQGRFGVFLLVVIANVVVFLTLASDMHTGAITAATLLVVARSAFSISAFANMNNNTMALSLGASCFPAMLALRERSHGQHIGTRDPADLPVKEIRFENVAFTYPNDTQPVYTNLNLTIRAGESLGIVGHNGAGKTTLIKLLARLYEPTSGRILVDDIPLTEFDPHLWQRRIAPIFQDFVHYPLSVRDNVSFGAIHIKDDQDRLDAAVQLVGADELLASFPHGWETVLSRQYDKGIDISGGQWQRIALARALFAVQGGAGVLVLDEPTANLDARAEVHLFDRFLEVTHGATAILISHRFSTVRRANRIVVIEDGAVVEEGTHAELLAMHGAYAQAFSLQAGWY